jgi:V/A-type H+-transporting ATPase subunit I
MAVAKLKKAEFYIYKSDVDGVLSALQNTGSYEVVPFSSDSGPEVSALIHPDFQRVESLLGETRFLLRFLEPHFSDPVSGIARAMGEKDDLSLEEGKALDAKTDLKAIAEDVRKLERRLMEIRSEVTQLDSIEQLLTSLHGFPYPLELITSGTDHIHGALGTIPADQTEQWKRGAASILGIMGEYYTVPASEKEKDRIVALFYDDSVSGEALELNARHSFNRIEIPPALKGKVEEELAAIAEKKERLAEEEKLILEKAAKSAEGLVPTIRSLSDFYSVLKDKYLTLSSARSTEQVVMLRGWIPEDSVAEVRRELSKYDSSIELILSDPAEGDEPPSNIVNPSWCLPFENLTRLYGAPKYGELDPTPFLAPFFFIFFGMCLGDAGYGLIMIGFFVWFLRKFKKMPTAFSHFFKLFVLSGISTVIVGALTGSWFGDLVDAFGIFSFLRPLKNAPVLLNPMENPMVFLGISLALGVVQLMFGLGIAFYDALRKKNYMGAFADTGGWIVFLVGLLIWGGLAAGVVPAGAGAIGKVFTIAGALVLVATQGREKTGLVSKAVSGLLSLYGVTSYLGDVLSYSRLLALGLATSAVGVIINMLAGLAGGVPYVGWILAVVLIIGGHIFSIAVNVLGAFVHSLRLQYVEFFSKFYTGGGKIFAPLTYNTNYVRIKKENQDQ